MTTQRTLLDLGDATSGPRAGWTRTDPRPWTKTAARWAHVAGWRLEHCGHPTATYPWALYAPAGWMVRTGVLHGNAAHGGAWSTLETAMGFVAAVIAGARPMPEPPPALDTKMGCVERAVVRRRAGT